MNVRFTLYLHTLSSSLRYSKTNSNELKIIAKFEQPIWSYTREYFTYQMLNRALRNLESDTIIKMSIFMRHLHRQILSKIDFEKLTKIKDGGMSFNNFLSTNTKRDISLGFTEYVLVKSDVIVILFIWERLGNLSLKIDHFKRAEELYHVLLEASSDELGRAVYYSQLGCVKNHPGNCVKSYNNIGFVYQNMKDYSEALIHFERALKIFKISLPQKHIFY
uniref:TPR domain containing protein-like protein n=1 Tax=Adineta vaga TaxID=104782 RepID=B3G498_ADIVA|nr:TPR domain containing protein-like protein [Adineta vaga]